MQHIDIFGGLGNQMFQYAFYLSKKKSGCDVIPDISLFSSNKKHLMHNGFELNKIFNLNPSVTFHSSKYSLYLIKFAFKLHLSKLITIDNVYWGYQETLKNSNAYHLYGYWQSQKYFSNAMDVVRSEFVFKNIDHDNLSLSRLLNDDGEHVSVSLHVRRGDYYKFNMKILGSDYYSKAINYFLSRLEKPMFYVFSDDMDAAVEIVEKIGVEYRPVTINVGENSYKDMFLMSQCKHNIIANSSFSWWGAWLNNNKEKIVVAPSWYKDFNCEDWITL
jgi:hypothetical protein